MSVEQNIRGEKCPWSEISVVLNVREPKSLWTKMSVGRNVRGSKHLRTEMFGWKCLSWNVSGPKPP